MSYHYYIAILYNVPVLNVKHRYLSLSIVNSSQSPPEFPIDLDPMVDISGTSIGEALSISSVLHLQQSRNRDGENQGRNAV